MSIVLAIIRWTLGVFFALGFLAYLTTSPLSAVASLVLAVMLIPPLANYVFTKIPYTFPRKGLIVFGIVLFIVWVSAAPKSEVKGVSTSITPTQIPTATSTPIPSEKPTVSPTEKPTNTPTPQPTTKPLPTATPTVYVYPTATPTTYVPPAQSSGYTCDCSKTCTEISSCAEAQYQLNNCGCAQRDADHDGIACDSAPLHCEN